MLAIAPVSAPLSFGLGDPSFNLSFPFKGEGGRGKGILKMVLTFSSSA